MKNFKNKIAIKSLGFLLSLAMLFWALAPVSAYAATLTAQTAKATGSYADPSTGIIEDSGGSTNKALGESMVGNVVANQALVETAEDGSYLITLRFNLTGSMGDINLYTQSPGGSSWSKAAYTVTGSTDDSKDMQIKASSTDIVVRAECYVTPMGRSVIFFVTFSDLKEGNSGGFKQTASTEQASTQSTTSASELLDDTTGLTTGDATADASIAGIATTDTVTTDAVTANAATADTVPIADSSTPLSGEEATSNINISARVWFVLFSLVFAAIVFAIILLFFLYQLFLKLTGSSRQAGPVYRVNKDEEYADLSLDNFDIAELDLEGDQEC